MPFQKSIFYHNFMKNIQNFSKAIIYDFYKTFSLQYNPHHQSFSISFYPEYFPIFLPPEKADWKKPHFCSSIADFHFISTKVHSHRKLQESRWMVECNIRFHMHRKCRMDLQTLIFIIIRVS